MKIQISETKIYNFYLQSLVINLVIDLFILIFYLIFQKFTKNLINYYGTPTFTKLKKWKIITKRWYYYFRNKKSLISRLNINSNSNNVWISRISNNKIFYDGCHVHININFRKHSFKISSILREQKTTFIFRRIFWRIIFGSRINPFTSIVQWRFLAILFRKSKRIGYRPWRISLPICFLNNCAKFFTYFIYWKNSNR